MLFKQFYENDMKNQDIELVKKIGRRILKNHEENQTRVFKRYVPESEVIEFTKAAVRLAEAIK